MFLAAMSTSRSGEFYVGFKYVEKKFNGCLRKVSKVFQGCFKEVLWKFQGCLKKVSSGFEENVTKGI